jgi:uncharacterized protein YjiS (DUF1127 family)
MLPQYVGGNLFPAIKPWEKLMKSKNPSQVASPSTGDRGTVSVGFAAPALFSVRGGAIDPPEAGPAREHAADGDHGGVSRVLRSVMSWLLKNMVEGLATYAETCSPYYAHLPMDDERDRVVSAEAGKRQVPHLRLVSFSDANSIRFYGEVVASDAPRRDVPAIIDVPKPASAESTFDVPVAPSGWRSWIAAPTAGLLSKLRRQRERRRVLDMLKDFDDEILADVRMSRAESDNFVRPERASR